MAAVRSVICAGGIAVLALVGSASAATPGGDSSSGLQVVGPEALKLSIKTGSHQTEPVTVWLRNPTAITVRPKFSAQLEDEDDTAGDVISVLPDEGSAFRVVPAKSVQHYRLVMRGVDDSNGSTGQLVISADTGKSSRAAAPAPATISVTVDPKRSYGNTYYWVLFGPAALALALVAIGWLAVRTHPGKTIASADLNFSSGFASTLTIVGALLGTIIAAGVLPPETTHLADDAYKALNIIFLVLIASAVVIFSAFQKQTTDKDGNPELRAYVGAFMLACAVTAWAAFGELVTLWFLIWDINGTSGLTDAGVLVLDIMIVSAGIAMVIYVLRRIKQVATEPTVEPATTVSGPLHITTIRNLDGMRVSLAIGAVGEAAEPGQERELKPVMLASQPPHRRPRFVL
jgi:hypothetical protein